MLTVIGWCMMCAAIVFFIVRLRRTQRIFIPDFKRGVQFINGSFTTELGPGHYEFSNARQHVELIDMRPQPIVFQRIFYRDAWKNDAMATISAELSVCDARQAATTLKNQVADTMLIVTDGIRSALAATITQDNPEFRTVAATEITHAANLELKEFGMTIGNVEIFESCFRPALVPTEGVTQ